MESKSLPMPRRKNSLVRALKRSVTQSSNELETEKPVLRKTSSVGNSLVTKINSLTHSKSGANVEKALHALQLDASECEELHEKLRVYAEPEPLKPNQILKTSIQVYEEYKLRVDSLVNFHTQPEYENLLFCYLENCSESTDSHGYIKCLTLTDYSGSYAVFRLIKFCRHCFDEYFVAQLKQPDDPLFVRMNERAYKLFSVLSLR